MNIAVHFSMQTLHGVSSDWEKVHYSIESRPPIRGVQTMALDIRVPYVKKESCIHVASGLLIIFSRRLTMYASQIFDLKHFILE